MHLCSKSVEICKWLVKRKIVNLSEAARFSFLNYKQRSLSFFGKASLGEKISGKFLIVSFDC